MIKRILVVKPKFSSRLATGVLSVTSLIFYVLLNIKSSIDRYGGAGDKLAFFA